MEKIERVLNILKRPDGRAVVLGLGVSNVPLARVLLGYVGNDRLIIRDKKTKNELDVPELLENAVFITGTDPTKGLCDRNDMSDTVIFRSPGIRPDAGDIQEAVRRGAVLYSEMEWFAATTPASIFAITGSDGKTTTTTLTNLLLRNSGHTSFVGGNIGTPLLDRVGEMTKDDYAVLELSSFQLSTLKGGTKRAAITNISPNHLNWHTDMAEYTVAKHNVFDDDTELLVLNAKNELSFKAAERFKGHVTFFTARNSLSDTFDSLTHNRPDSDLIYVEGDDIVFTDGKKKETVISINDILLPGVHNVENYMTAIALTRGLVDNGAIKNLARTFGGVEHRFEFVREYQGIKYYNSSIDSSPTRTCAALSNLTVPTVCICGGQDKHVPFAPLAEALLDKTIGVVLTGEAMYQIKSAIDEARLNKNKETELTPDRIILEPDFDKAVYAARNLAVSGGIILLSPACTSFDHFKNFEERGNHFKKIISELK